MSSTRCSQSARLPGENIAADRERASAAAHRSTHSRTCVHLARITRGELVVESSSRPDLNPNDVEQRSHLRVVLGSFPEDVQRLLEPLQRLQRTPLAVVPLPSPRRAQFSSPPSILGVVASGGGACADLLPLRLELDAHVGVRQRLLHLQQLQKRRGAVAAQAPSDPSGERLRLRGHTHSWSTVYRWGD